MPDQRGRTVVITGANSGLGLRSAEALAGSGARVLMACRNPDKGASALEAVTAKASGPAPELVSLDLSEPASIEAAAADITSRTDHVDVLMNNAGVMAIPLRRNSEGWELQFATNHLGHFALTGRLLPALLAAEAPRVVTTSSQASRPGKVDFRDPQWERRRYSRWFAYSQSKFSNLLFAFELARRAEAAGSDLVSVAAHPGYAATHLQAVGPEMEGNKLMGRVMAATNRVMAQSDADGALPQLYAATMPDVKPSEYFGPKGFGEQKGPPVRVRAKGSAYDEGTAKKLWDLSEELTGVAYDFGGGASSA
jgi:NAD(P)-dependent dehydrogenase (short-subunit alcohol dehydrogenase family)